MSTRTSERQKNNNFIKQGSILAAASLIVRMIGMVYRIPMSNILGEEGNGIYAVAFDIYDIVLIISSYSLPLALSKIISAQNSEKQYKNTGRTFRCALTFALVSGGAFGILLFAFAEIIEKNVYAQYIGVHIPLRILAPTIFLVALLGVFRGFFQGKSTMIPTAVSQVIEQVVNAFVSVFAAYTFMKVHKGSPEQSAWGAAGGTMGTCLGALSALLMVMAVYVLYRPVQKRLERRDTHRSMYPASHIYRILFLTILPIILSQTVYQISGLIDYYLFGKLMAYKDVDPLTIKSLVGVYSSKYRLLCSVPIAISTSMASSMIPAAVSAFTQKDDQTLNANILSGIKFNMIIAFPCAIGYMVLGQPIIRLLFPSSDYVLGGYLMLSGSFAVVFYAISNVTGGALQSIDKMSLPVIHSAISLVIHVIILAGFLRFTNVGIFALIIGNVTFPIVVSVLNIMALYRYLHHFHMDFMKTFFIPLSASLWMAIVSFLCFFSFRKLFSLCTGDYVANALSLMITLLVAVVMYFVVFLLLKGMTKEEMYQFPMGRKMYVMARRMKLMK